MYCRQQRLLFAHISIGSTWNDCSHSSGIPQSTEWEGRVRTVPPYVLEHAVSAPQISVKSQYTNAAYNESTAGADASVEMPKLHNIKLLIPFIHT